MANDDIVIPDAETPNGIPTTRIIEGGNILDNDAYGKKAPLVNEQESQFENGCSFPMTLGNREGCSKIVDELSTRKGRDKIRRLLGPPLPGCEEEESDDN